MSFWVIWSGSSWGSQTCLHYPDWFDIGSFCGPLFGHQASSHFFASTLGFWGGPVLQCLAVGSATRAVCGRQIPDAGGFFTGDPAAQ